MFTIPEQFSEASREGFQKQLTLASALAAKTFEGVEKIIDLNLSFAKESVDGSNAAAKQLFSVKDPQEWLSVGAAFAQPNAEKVLAYGRELAGIASSVQAEFTRAAEAQIAESSRHALGMVEELTKTAPAGSESAVAFVKTMIGNATAGYEQFRKNSKEAAETIEASMNTAVNQYVQPAAPKSGRARK